MAKLYKNKPEKPKEQSIRDAWMETLKKEEKANGKKRERAQKVCDVYADERDNETASQFNILWSNVNILSGALYSKSPKPDVRRRFIDKDPVSREVAAVLERGTSFVIDSYDFDGTADVAVNDYLTAGYGQVRVRYKPYFSKGKSIPITAEEDGTFRYNGETVEPEIVDDQPMYSPDEIAYQEITCEPLEWKKFRWDHLAKRWEDVNWCCIDHYMTRTELVENFGDVGKKISLTHSDSGKKEKESDQTHALVHEIFDKKKRQIVMVSEGYKEGPIETQDDALNLTGFYPFPKPMFATQVSGSLFPVPDFVFYQDQADELNKVTARIEKLVDALRVRGVYDQSFSELKNLLSSGDNDLTPVKDFAARFDGKDLHSVIAFMPIEELAKVLAGLYQQRDQVKMTIYEITGISDIVRGSTDPNETLGAQQLKGQFADMRLTKRRNRVNAFLRDIVRIKAEIIAEHFEPTTLQLMTGIEVNEQMTQIMRSDVLRSFKVDIETESTMAVDAEAEQKNRLEALTTLSQFMQLAVPAVQAGLIPKEVAKELALFGIRGFKNARQLEDMLERLGAEDQNDPAVIKSQLEQAKQQIQMLQAQLQEGAGMLQQLQQQADGKQAEVQAKQQTEQGKLQASVMTDQAKLEFEREKFAMQMQLEQARLQLEQSRFQLEQVNTQLTAQSSEREFALKQEAAKPKAENDESIRQAVENISEALAMIITKMNEPKPFTYDAQGRIAAVGDRQVIRDGSGRIQTLN